MTLSYLTFPSKAQIEAGHNFSAGPYKMTLDDADQDLLKDMTEHPDVYFRVVPDSLGQMKMRVEVSSPAGFRVMILHLVDQADAYREEHGEDDHSLCLASSLLETIGIEWV